MSASQTDAEWASSHGAAFEVEPLIEMAGARRAMASMRHELSVP